MASPSYSIVFVDLAVPRTDQLLTEVGIGVKYNAVSIIAIPAAANVSIKFGPSLPFISLSAMSAGQGFSFLDDCANPFYADEGLYVSNPAAAGTLILFVSFAGTGGGAQLST